MPASRRAGRLAPKAPTLPFTHTVCKETFADACVERERGLGGVEARGASAKHGGPVRARSTKAQNE